MGAGVKKPAQMWRAFGSNFGSKEGNKCYMIFSKFTCWIATPGL